MKYVLHTCAIPIRIFFTPYIRFVPTQILVFIALLITKIKLNRKLRMMLRKKIRHTHAYTLARFRMATRSHVGRVKVIVVPIIADRITSFVLY